MIDEEEELAQWRKLTELAGPRERNCSPGQSIRYNGQFYEFADLVPLYGSAFTARLLNTFIAAFGEFAPSGNAKRNQALRRFLKFVAIEGTRFPDSASGRVLETLQLGNLPSLNDMKSVASLMGDRIRDFNDFTVLSSSNRTYRATFLETLSASLRNLAPFGLWPIIPPIRRIDDRGHSHIKSLGELTTDAQEPLKGADAFAQSVELSVNRLAALRSVAEDILAEEYAFFKRGQELIENVRNVPISKIAEAVSNLGDYGANRLDPIVKNIFPLDDEDRRVGCLLRFCALKQHGRISGNSENHYGYERLVNYCGGTSKLIGYIEGTRRALLAAQIIVLADTGMNVQPCNDMPTDPFFGEARRGKIQLMTLSSTKTRPSPKTIFTSVAVPEADALLKVPNTKFSTVDAIRIWQELSEPIRKRAKSQRDGTDRFLWICPRDRGNGGKIRQFSIDSAKSQWVAIQPLLDSEPKLSGLTFSRQNIRPTFIAIRAARNMDEYTLIQAIASHNSAAPTFGTYLDRAAYHETLSSMIRAFQDRLEAAILITSPKRLVHIALEAETAARRAFDAVTNGLEEILLDPIEAKNELLDISSVNQVPEISPYDLFDFAPRPDDLIVLLLFHRGIASAEKDFLATNPRRWVTVWLPGYALLTAAIDRIRASKYSNLIEHAEQSISLGLTDGSMREFKPW